MSEESKTVAKVVVKTWADIPASLSVAEANRLLSTTPGGWGLVTEGGSILAVIHTDDVVTWEPTEILFDHREEFVPLLVVEAILPLEQTIGCLARFLRLPAYRATRGVLVEDSGKVVGILSKAVLAEAGRNITLKDLERSRQGSSAGTPPAGTPLIRPDFWVCAPNQKHSKPVHRLMPGSFIATPVCRACGRSMQLERNEQ
jgi:hypothetical protein